MKILNELPPVTKKDDWICMDFETFGQEEGKVHRPTGTFAMLSICIDGYTVYQIYDEKQIPKVVKNVAKGTWIFHNATYDLTQMRRFAEVSPRFIWDTMLADKSMTGGLYTNYSLADLSRRWLGEEMKKEERKKFEHVGEITKSMKEYGARDATKTWKIAKLQQEEYSEELGFRAYLEVDEPCIFPVLDMPGIRVDADTWGSTVGKFKEIASNIEAELGFNVKSTEQTKAALGKVGIHVLSTNKKILKAFEKNALVQKIIEGRLYRDACSKYGVKWITESVEADGKVYCNYNLVGAETGRMSANSPNMQNIPVRHLPIYRTFFIASPGCVMSVSDVSQQEPRILAWESKDEEYLSIFREGRDSHLEVARIIFNEPTMKKDDPRRKNEGKMVNLGTSYGMSAVGLSEKLDISLEKAEQFLAAYFRKFRGVFSWISMQRATARERGFVKTAIGRKIYLNPYSSHFDNNAINAPIQGGAADFTKVWLRYIWEGCQKAGIPYTVVAIVHDEIVADVNKKHLPAYKKILNDAFHATAEKLYKGVPFEVEMETGKSWGCKQNSERLEDEDEE